MRISLDGRKPEGDWASFNELCGKGDGKTVAFTTPFPAKEARGLHVMRDYMIVTPDNIRRVLDPDGDLLRDEPDGYSISKASPDAPLTITFDRAPALGERISCSAVGRRPELDGGKPSGEAFKVLPMTDTLAKQLDEKMPPEFRKRKREANASLPAVQEMYREAYNRLVVDAYGFTDGEGAPLTWNEQVKKAILDHLGSFVVGAFAMNRAQILQRERSSRLDEELSD